MNKEETLSAIAVMQAFADGKRIEVRTPRSRLEYERDWYLVKPHETPNWDWDNSEYRIAVEKPSIDWSHVSSEYRYLAVDGDELALLYAVKPNRRAHDWRDENNLNRHTPKASTFASYKRGTCHWKESLVERPEGV